MMTQTKEVEARARDLGAKQKAIEKWRLRGIPAKWQLKLMETEMTQTETTTPADPIAAKHQIHKIQDVLSLILAAAHSISKGDLEDDQGPAAGIAEAAEHARALLYDLMDVIGIDKAPTEAPQ